METPFCKECGRNPLHQDSNSAEVASVLHALRLSPTLNLGRCPDSNNTCEQRACAVHRQPGTCGIPMAEVGPARPPQDPSWRALPLVLCLGHIRARSGRVAAIWPRGTALDESGSRGPGAPRRRKAAKRVHICTSLGRPSLVRIGTKSARFRPSLSQIRPSLGQTRSGFCGFGR